MSDLPLPISFIDDVLQMGYPYSAIKLAQQATNSRDSKDLLEWILTHENEIYVNESNKTYAANQTIQRIIELGFSKNSAELAQRKTKSNDVQTLIEWILDHDPPENYRSILVPSITNRLEVTTTNDTLLNDLLKLGFDMNDMESCFTELAINKRKKSNSAAKRIECIDWLIGNSQRKAQLKAKEIDRSRRRLRIPAPIKLNNYQASSSCTATPPIITNNFLKQVHLEGRHQTIANDEQEPPLTTEEAIMASIHENLKRQSWTIHNLDQLHLIQKYIKIVARIIDEDRHNIKKRYSDDEETQSVRPTTAKPSTKKIFTLADLTEKDRTDDRPHLATPPRKFHVPGALERGDWDLSLLEELDRIAMGLKYRPGENYRQLANRLIEECHVSSGDQKSTIRAIFVWITNHIRYDIKTSTRDNSLNENEENLDELCQLILDTQSCVCAGYAILFKRMCQHFNIRVDYVGGYTKRTKSCINDTAGNDKSEKLSGHAWTMVYLDGKTYFTDPTWSAATWSSPSRMRSPFSNTYYLVPPKDAIYQFRPRNDCDQHLDVPWSIERFIQEPCFYPNYFRLKFTLEDRDTEWFHYRIIVDRSKQTSLTKSFRIITREFKADSIYPLKMFGHMYWNESLSALADDLSRLKNTDYEHKLNAAEFEPMDPTYADNHLNDKRIIHIAALENIPIYPPKLDVYQIQYGLLKIYATDQSNGRYEPIFECIFEFQ